MAVLVLMFGAYSPPTACSGVWAIANRHGEPAWVPLVIGARPDAAGIVTFLPAITTVALLMIMAAWAIALGVTTVVAAIRLRKEITGEWRLVLSGLLSVALGVILVAAPGAGALAMVLWIGGYAIASGILQIALGFRLKSWGRVQPAALASHPRKVNARPSQQHNAPAQEKDMNKVVVVFGDEKQAHAGSARCGPPSEGSITLYATP
jgi:uncharacterized membrane protein HdeD (DUF308 family)